MRRRIQCEFLGAIFLLSNIVNVFTRCLYVCVFACLFWSFMELILFLLLYSFSFILCLYVWCCCKWGTKSSPIFTHSLLQLFQNVLIIPFFVFFSLFPHSHHHSPRRCRRRCCIASVVSNRLFCITYYKIHPHFDGGLSVCDVYKILHRIYVIYVHGYIHKGVMMGNLTLMSVNNCRHRRRHVYELLLTGMMLY